MTSMTGDVADYTSMMDWTERASRPVVVAESHREEDFVVGQHSQRMSHQGYRAIIAAGQELTRAILAAEVASGWSSLHSRL